MIVKGSLVLTVLVVITIPVTAGAQPQLITLSIAAAGSQLEPATLATNLFDPNSDFTLAPGTTIHIKNDAYPVAMNAHAIGVFSFGNVAAGTLLEDPIDENAFFSGGIGIDHGVCLSTGFLSDSDPTRIPFAPWVGVEGPNNGVGENPANDGEVSKDFWQTAFGDEDFHAIYPNLPLGGDPAVLDFNIDLHSPGFLRLSFVFASDEFPAFILHEFNDSVAILVKGPSEPEESPGVNIATFIRNGVVENFTLQTLASCPLNFLKNQMSPRALNEFPDSEHKIKPRHTARRVIIRFTTTSSVVFPKFSRARQRHWHPDDTRSNS